MPSRSWGEGEGGQRGGASWPPPCVGWPSPSAVNGVWADRRASAVEPLTPAPERGGLGRGHGRTSALLAASPAARPAPRAGRPGKWEASSMRRVTPTPGPFPVPGKGDNGNRPRQRVGASPWFPGVGGTDTPTPLRMSMGVPSVCPAESLTPAPSRPQGGRGGGKHTRCAGLPLPLAPSPCRGRGTTAIGHANGSEHLRGFRVSEELTRRLLWQVDQSVARCYPPGYAGWVRANAVWLSVLQWELGDGFSTGASDMQR